ncbi:hypothetical protein CDAR_236871 [Caerostris darwini]|uniref:Uncharacterized protein n=1 Tax=Caerostris darwini TaxID=1538125 RepID=A0AAV4S4R8_9ARAC|nr:hypothetical protein CDAR_236871 [Caerostris darwini]
MVGLTSLLQSSSPYLHYHEFELFKDIDILFPPLPPPSPPLPTSSGKLFHCKCSRKDSRGQRSESRHHKTPSITIDIHITMRHDGEEEKKAATSPTGDSILTYYNLLSVLLKVNCSTVNVREKTAEGRDLNRDIVKRHPPQLTSTSQ